MKILHLEDSARDAELVRLTLEEAGFAPKLEVVETAEAFIKALDAPDLDLVLSDYKLPSFDGLAALEIVDRKRPGLPFIFVSGALGEEVAIEMLKRGATDYVLKHNLDRLAPVVRRALLEVEERRQRRVAEQRYQEIFEHALEGIFQSTLDGRFLNANPALARMLGYDSPEALLKAVTDIPQQLYADRARRAALGHMAEEQDKARGFDVELYRRDGTKIWALINAQLVRDEAGAPLYYEGFVQDITERKRTELAIRRSRDELESEVAKRTRELTEANLRLRDLDRLKSEFLANMSHELRTPLNAIIGFAQLMHDGKVGAVSAEHQEYLGDILSSAEHLLQLINEILDNAKVEAGRMEVTHTTFRLEDVIAEVTQHFTPIVSAKNIKLVRDIPEDWPPITTDRRKLLQILLNLTSNAVKFTERGEVSIKGQVSHVAPGAQEHDTVAQRREANSEGRDRSDEIGGSDPGEERRATRVLELSVTDTGIGIEAKDLELLFKPFSQIDAGLRKRHEGTGLGLHLSQKLAHLLGGEITVRSEFGKGSTFTLTLPLAPQPNE